jgi:hypothetical protein
MNNLENYSVWPVVRKAENLTLIFQVLRENLKTKGKKN